MEKVLSEDPKKRKIPPPWNHQKDIIAKARTEDSWALFLEMGTGKTYTAIQLLRLKYAEAGHILKTLVFCPPVVRNQWKKEFMTSSRLEEKEVHVLEGPGKKRTKYFEDKAFDHVFGPIAKGGVFITNYESLNMDSLYQLMQEWRPEVIIFDESHMLKSHKTKRFKRSRTLADLAKNKYILTGTPILNTAMDVWSQFRILDQGATFGDNFWVFQARYFYDRNAGMPSHKHFPDMRPRPGIEKTFNELIYKKASRVLKKQCLDLPDLVRKRVEVELSTEQLRMYKDMMNHFIAYLDEKTVAVASIALTKALRLQQIVSGFILDEGTNKAVGFKKNPRMEALKDLVGEILDNKQQVIIWSCFRHDAAHIEAMIKDELGHQCSKIVGGLGPKVLQENIDKFRSGTHKVVIANQQAGGTGLNLIEAGYAIYYSRNFSLEADLQSEARNHRGGSEIHEKVTRVDIVAKDTIDEVVLDALSRKEDLANSILKIKELL